jgi:hypothetical protein
LPEKHLEHIKFQRIRPRIRVETDYTPHQLSELFSNRLKQADANIEGTVMSNFINIEPLKADQHYWSPQLAITIEETERGSLMRGLYGPKPSVWTMFVFFYSVIGFAALIVSMIGLSFWSLGKETTILWLVPLLILLFLSLYLVAYLGQKFGHKQMIHLHHFVEECLGERIEAK